jgi:ribonuclease D
MSDERRVISRDEVNALPIRRWEGEVRVVSTPHEVAPALAEILAEGAVGFDTETRPAFRPGESYPPSLAQFATARAVYLLPLRHREAAAALAQILAAAQVVKAGVGTKDDLRALRRVIGFEERSVVDLGAAAARQGLKQSGVRNLAGMFLGFRIPKGTKTTNWARPRLSPQQVAYAATDAWACRELYVKFRSLGYL